MEAVAEAVMDMQAILLENKTNVDKLEMWNIKGQYIVWNHTFLPSFSHLQLAAILCGWPAILKLMCVTVNDWDSNKKLCQNHYLGDFLWCESVMGEMERIIDRKPFLGNQTSSSECFNSQENSFVFLKSETKTLIDTASFVNLTTDWKQLAWFHHWSSLINTLYRLYNLYKTNWVYKRHFVCFGGFCASLGREQ